MRVAKAFGKLNENTALFAKQRKVKSIIMGSSYFKKIELVRRWAIGISIF